tara:strand:+ start:2976 stop:3974 length:999 start_codon:yes stop_codon:yes gene_type:complete
LFSINKISVIGAGSWGTAVANLLAQSENFISLYHYRTDFVNELKKNRIHPYLKDTIINPQIDLTSDINKLSDSDYFFIAVPTKSLRSLFKSTSFPASSNIVSLSKGIEKDTHLFPSDIIMDCTNYTENNICVLSGPTHAEEVSLNIPSAVVVAGTNITLNRKIQELLSTPTFRVYSNSDIKGVEISGAIKNIISIASGMCIGLGFGDNTTAALITRGLNEIIRLGDFYGAEISTFYGLAGIGDLSVTAFSTHSRNREFGIKIAEGCSALSLIKDMGMIVEGYYTSYALNDIIDANNLEMPISKSVYSILYEDLSPKQAIMNLMSRDLTHENN